MREVSAAGTRCGGRGAREYVIKRHFRGLGIRFGRFLGRRLGLCGQVFQRHRRRRRRSGVVHQPPGADLADVVKGVFVAHLALHDYVIDVTKGTENYIYRKDLSFFLSDA